MLQHFHNSALFLTLVAAFIFTRFALRVSQLPPGISALGLAARMSLALGREELGHFRHNITAAELITGLKSSKTFILMGRIYLNCSAFYQLQFIKVAYNPNEARVVNPILAKLAQLKPLVTQGVGERAGLDPRVLHLLV